MADDFMTINYEDLVSRIMDLETHYLIQKEFISFLFRQSLGLSGESFDKHYESVFQKIKSERLLSLQSETGVFQKDAEAALKSLKDELGL